MEEQEIIEEYKKKIKECFEKKYSDEYLEMLIKGVFFHGQLFNSAEIRF